MSRKSIRIVALSILLLLSFWAGSAWERFRYEDVCLDLGGGMQPGGYPICVVEK